MKKLADIFSIGAQLIGYCPDRGWIIAKVAGENKEFYMTAEGITELKKCKN